MEINLQKIEYNFSDITKFFVLFCCKTDSVDVVSDKFMIILVPHESIPYLQITFSIYIYDVLTTLPPLTFYMYIFHNST